MPVAVVVDDPKLERMSLRTTPLCPRTSGPFEPSPGYGPAVSSGIGDDGSAAVAAVVAALVDAVVADVVAFGVAAEDVVEVAAAPLPLELQPTRTASAPPP